MPECTHENDNRPSRVSETDTSGRFRAASLCSHARPFINPPQKQARDSEWKRGNERVQTRQLPGPCRLCCSPIPSCLSGKTVIAIFANMDTHTRTHRLLLPPPIQLASTTPNYHRLFSFFSPLPPFFIIFIFPTIKKARKKNFLVQLIAIPPGSRPPT